MPETIGKKFGERDISLLDKIKTNDTGLDFSKGFTYKNPDLDNVHNSPSETKELNRKKAEKYLGEEIKDKKLTEEEIKTRTDSMTIQQAKWFNEKAKTDEYDLNTLYSYIDHWDERKNPNAKGIGMFEKKGSTSIDTSYWKPVGRTAGALGVTEVAGRSLSALGNYQFNRTMDKYLPQDVSRLTRYTKYEKVPNVLSEELAKTNEQIEKAEQRLGKTMKNKLVNGGVNDETKRNLEELYARRDAIKESLDAIESTKKNLPKEKPETARETAKKMKLRGSDLNAAGQASTKSSVYYTTEIAPLYKQVTTKFNMGEIFDSLTKDDFPGLTESEWNDMKEVISKEKEAYSKYSDISAEELHKKLDDFDLSKQRIKGEESKGLNSQFKDAVHTKINNMLDEAVERELPGHGIKNKKLIYNNMLNIENELKDYATSGGKRKSQSVLKDLRDGTTRSIKLRRGLGTNLRTAGEAITPTKQIPKLINGIKNIISKTKNVTTNVSNKVVEAVNPKNLIDPKNFKQPKLLGGDPVGTLQLLEGLGGLWDSMLGGDTTVGDISEKIGEIPAIKAADALDDMLRSSYQWSLLSEEEKPYYMQDILEELYPDETVTIEDAEAIYKSMKEHGSIYLGEYLNA